MKRIAIATVAIAATVLALHSCGGSEAPAKQQTDSGSTEATTALPEKEVEEYRKRGREVAVATGKTLVGEVMAAMEAGGAAEAIGYCNITALPITDSIAQANGVNIRRTSMKYRNSANAPTAWETEVLRGFEADAAAGKELAPLVRLDAQSKPHFCAPIIVQPLCVTCHGEVGNTLDTALHELLLSQYPEDRATGFKVGDLRGMWSIAFPNEENTP